MHTEHAMPSSIIVNVNAVNFLPSLHPIETPLGTRASKLKCSILVFAHPKVLLICCGVLGIAVQYSSIAFSFRGSRTQYKYCRAVQTERTPLAGFHPLLSDAAPRPPTLFLISPALKRSSVAPHSDGRATRQR